VSGKLLATEQVLTRVFTDARGNEVMCRVVLDIGYPLDRCVQRLANKVRSSRMMKVASARPTGLIRVSIVKDPASRKVSP
jgi:hypothetical protein